MSRKRRHNKNKSHKMTRHHIIPISRSGSSKLENLAKVRDFDHRKYHALFSNKRPEEIVRYLVKHYWKGDWSYVERAYENRYNR